MTISKLLIFQEVYLSCPEYRPSHVKYSQCVVNALVEEKSALFRAKGKILNQELFKSNSGFKSVVKAFVDEVRRFWTDPRNNGNCEKILERHNGFFKKDFDFSKIDFAPMLSDIIDVPEGKNRNAKIEIESKGNFTLFEYQSRLTI